MFRTSCAWQTVFLLVSGLLAIGASPCRADAIIAFTQSGAATGSVKDNGLTFTVTDCTWEGSYGGISASTTCAGTELEFVTSSTGSTEVEFLGNGHNSNQGTNVISLAGSKGTANYLVVNLTVTDTALGKISGFSTAMTTSTDSLNYYTTADVTTAGVTCSTSGGFTSGPNQSAGTVSGGTNGTTSGYVMNTSTTCSPTEAYNITSLTPSTTTFGYAISSLNITYTLGVNGNFTTGVDSLQSATATFFTVPEPGSIGVMSVGIAAVAALRRRRRPARPVWPPERPG